MYLYLYLYAYIHTYMCVCKYLLNILESKHFLIISLLCYNFSPLCCLISTFSYRKAFLSFYIFRNIFS